MGVPSETVYGLAGDALNPVAAAKIFEAKQRPFFDPLICHLPAKDWLNRLAVLRGAELEIAERLAARFWPGPLTLVLRRSDMVPELVCSGLDTVALRMPSHPVFRSLLSRFGRPLAAPSANRFGRISPTEAGHVLSELAGRIPMILDGGSTQHGIESTIVSVDGRAVRILRSGPVTAEDLRSEVEVLPAYTGSAARGRVEAPGQLESHYAPQTQLVLARALEYPRSSAPGWVCLRGRVQSRGFLRWRF